MILAAVTAIVATVVSLLTPRIEPEHVSAETSSVKIFLTIRLSWKKFHREKQAQFMNDRGLVCAESTIYCNAFCLPALATDLVHAL